MWASPGSKENRDTVTWVLIRVAKTRKFVSSSGCGSFEQLNGKDKGVAEDFLSSQPTCFGDRWLSALSLILLWGTLWSGWKLIVHTSVLEKCQSCFFPASPVSKIVVGVGLGVQTCAAWDVQVIDFNESGCEGPQRFVGFSEICPRQSVCAPESVTLCG